MKVRYIGAHRHGVELDVLGVFVPHGGEIDVPDEVAVSLLEQACNWEAVKAPAKPQPESPTPEED